jgi:hypothetical protein
VSDREKLLAEVRALPAKWRKYADASKRVVSANRMRECADDLDKALTAALRAEPGAWRPIESAPRDGGYVLALAYPSARPAIVHWHEEIAGNGRWCIDPETFMDDSQFNDYWESTRYEPTHWMPLPESPK